MKRISCIVKGVSESVKAQFKEKRIEKAVEAAMLNAQEELEIAKAELDELPTKTAEMEASDVVQTISDLICKYEEAEETLKHLEKIKAYLNEEVEE